MGRDRSRLPIPELTRPCLYRLCRREGHADARDRPGVQAVPDVRDDQHRRHGRLFAVRPVPCLSRVTARMLACLPASVCVCRLIPETKGRSLEEMDVIFGAVQADKRRADIAAQARGMSLLSLLLANTLLSFSLTLTQSSSRTCIRARILCDVIETADDGWVERADQRPGH